MSALVYYVSGHGFGHAVRSAEIMRELRRRRPDVPIFVRTSAPAWLFPPEVRLEPVELDVGVVQPDALRIDAGATLARMASLARCADTIVAREAEFIRSVGAAVVAADIPPLAFLAASVAQRPALAVANFSWDWIYQPYVRQHPEYTWLLDWLRAAYTSATRLLRLPFHGDLSAFRGVEDVPLVNRPPSAARPELRRRLALDEEARAVLLSFGGLGLRGLNPRPLAVLDRYTFLSTSPELWQAGPLPPNVRFLPGPHDNYSDLVAACDVVVTKPGFGIVANCLALRVPMLYTDRGEFAEYPILVEALHRFGHARFIAQTTLHELDLGPSLGALLDSEPRWASLPVDGARVIAERLLEYVGEPAGQT